MRRCVSILLGLLVLAACEREAPPPAADQAVRPARIFAVGSEVDLVRHDFVGRVEAAQTIDMTFRVPGLLVELPVLEGQSLRAGELIAAIDATDYELALREAEVQQELAGEDFKRKRRLLEDRGISQSIVDDAHALFELRQVAVAQARENLARTRLRAPFDAYVARRFTDNHKDVRIGEPVVRLTDLNELFVVANVPEALLATVTPERVVSLNTRFSFLPDRLFELTYRENRGESDAVAQTFEITFVMPRPEEWNILPGMTATVELELTDPSDERGLKIPTAALLSDAEKRYFVWVYDPDTQAVEKRMVSIGPAAGVGITVRSGLSPGELIVASGAANLQAGMKVRVLGQPVTAL